MARLGASKKKKSPHAADPRQLKKELKRVTEQLESRDRELEQRNCRIARGPGASDRNGRGPRHHQPLAHGRAARARRHRRERGPSLRNRSSGAAPPRRKRHGSAGSFRSDARYTSRDDYG